MPPPYGVTPGRFVRKPQSAIDDEVETALRAGISDDITLEADDPFAQAIRVLTSKLSELWEIAEAADAAQDPDRAAGAQLDAAAAMSGSLRRPATKSTVTGTVTLDDGADIAIGAAIASHEDFPERRFVNTEVMENSTGGQVQVPIEFEAEDAGPVQVSSGKLTVLETSPTGWTAITNVDDAVPGKPAETDAGFRTRREQELKAIGGGTVEGIRGDFLALDAVMEARIIENDEDLTDPVTGLPPHSFELVIDDGGIEDTSTYAQLLWDLKPAAIRTYGSQQGQATDSSGATHTVNFSYINEVTVYMRILLTHDAAVFASEAAAETAASDAIEAAAIDPEGNAYLGIGIDARARRLACAALEVPGILDVQAVVGLSAPASMAAGADSVVIDDRSKAVLATPIAFDEGGGSQEP